MFQCQYLFKFFQKKFMDYITVIALFFQRHTIPVICNSHHSISVYCNPQLLLLQFHLFF